MLQTTIFGNIGSEPVLAPVGSNKVINFSVAHNSTYKDKEGAKQTKTTWIDCSLWNNEGIFPYLKKGDPILVQGQISAEAYVKDDKAIGVLNLRVDTINLGGAAKKES